jgi:hypothetical protein
VKHKNAMPVLTLLAFFALPPDILIAQEAQTLKERLSDKASDNQRVDDCHVPAERRGAVPRPDCPPELPAIQPGVPMPAKTR